MKNGKSKKNSSAPLPPSVAPTELPKPGPILKKKRTSIPPAVAKARQAVQRVEPDPQPKVAANTKKRSKKKITVRAAAEPIPQPTPTGRARASTASASPRATVESLESPLIQEGSASPEQPATPVSAPLDKPPSPHTLSPSHPSVPGPTTAKTPRARQPRPVPVEIPAILLEPDHVPNEPAIAGPGARFALTPNFEPRHAPPPDDLPEAYGTERIFLAARDPYCLFASWDLNAKQRASYNSASASGAMTIRLRRGFEEGPIHLEVHTLPTARDRFIEVAQPDTTFVAELGYHEKNSGLWRRISFSKPITTPRDRVAAMQIPVAAPVVETVGAAAPSTEPPPAPSTEQPPRRSEPHSQVHTFEPPSRHEIIFAMQPPSETPRWSAKQEPETWRDKPRWEPPKEKPRWTPKKVPAPKWTPSKSKQLDELISFEFRRMQHGSIEIEEMLRRRVLRERELEAPSSLELLEELPPEEFLAKALGLAKPEAPSSAEFVEQPVGKKGFWFKVNTELIIYGSTEPDARVSIGGRPIRLRQDGTFSYRFALPDGSYELPVIAIAQDGHDGRAADLRFSRATRYTGDVPPHAQDPALKTPSPANV